MSLYPLPRSVLESRERNSYLIRAPVSWSSRRSQTAPFKLPCRCFVTGPFLRRLDRLIVQAAWYPSEGSLQLAGRSCISYDVPVSRARQYEPHGTWEGTCHREYCVNVPRWVR